MDASLHFSTEKPVLVLASSNAGKIAELKNLVGDAVHLATPPDLPEVEETGNTFQKNAHLKSLAISKHLNHPGVFVLADDSGIQVDALKGRPGVLSARYCQMANTRQAWDPRTVKENSITPAEREVENNRRMISDLKHVPVRRRGAQFHTVLSLVRDGKVLITVESVCRGKIARKVQGEKGFSYDRLFLPNGQAGRPRTFGEMEMEEKHRYSVRAKALEQMVRTMRHYHLLPEETPVKLAKAAPNAQKAELRTAVWVSESLRGRDERGRLPMVRNPDVRWHGRQT
ncbi:MAG: non-canonical purine NTP pyrophosphatase [Verrucomicrobium sp.]|nr:non-canonical purine NTP pyrophosphatase [Verrucomicrobium sp.]